MTADLEKFAASTAQQFSNIVNYFLYNPYNSYTLVVGTIYLINQFWEMFFKKKLITVAMKSKVRVEMPTFGNLRKTPNSRL